MMRPGDQVIGYRVHLLPPPPERVNGFTADPYSVDFKTKEEADNYKRQKQSEGWIANTSPVFLSPSVRGKKRKVLQQRTAPPKFNSDWRLHSTPPKDGG
jgi:hypothetical protein